MTTKTIKIAVQNKGRLKDQSLEYLNQYQNEFELISIRDDDIPLYVASGTADYGIVGENVFYENPSGAKIVKRLNFGKCKLVIAGDKTKNIQSIQGARISTPYPRLLRAFLNNNNLRAEIIEVAGSTEIGPKLGFCDLICDLVQSGKTLKENNLIEIVKIMDSEAILIENPTLTNKYNQF